MSVIIYQLAVLLALLQGVAPANINFYTSPDCIGDITFSCTSVPQDKCCSLKQEVDASAKLEGAPQTGFTFTVTANAGCSGVQDSGFPDQCIQPTFAIVSAMWNIIEDDATVFKNITTRSEDCQRPDTITIAEGDGKENIIKIPAGEYMEYENAFVKGDITTLKALSQ